MSDENAVDPAARRAVGCPCCGKTERRFADGNPCLPIDHLAPKPVK